MASLRQFDRTAFGTTMRVFFLTPMDCTYCTRASAVKVLPKPTSKPLMPEKSRLRRRTSAFW
ncbi:hypothetical protein D9M70_439700 [compost metagenome]